MPRASQFLGIGAVVECAVRNVNPAGPWKEAFPNGYERKRERFTVKGVDRTTPGSLTGAKVEQMPSCVTSTLCCAPRDWTR